MAVPRAAYGDFKVHYTHVHNDLQLSGQSILTEAAVQSQSVNDSYDRHQVEPLHSAEQMVTSILADQVHHVEPMPALYSYKNAACSTGAACLLSKLCHMGCIHSDFELESACGANRRT